MRKNPKKERDFKRIRENTIEKFERTQEDSKDSERIGKNSKEYE